MFKAFIAIKVTTSTWNSAFRAVSISMEAWFYRNKRVQDVSPIIRVGVHAPSLNKGEWNNYVAAIHGSGEAAPWWATRHLWWLWRTAQVRYLLQCLFRTKTASEIQSCITVNGPTANLSGCFVIPLDYCLPYHCDRYISRSYNGWLEPGVHHQ